MMALNIAALVVAGGTGQRLGGLPKQYRPLGGAPVLRRAIDAFLGHSDISAVQAVVGAGYGAEYRLATAGLSLLPVVEGGDTRQESVRRGLAALSIYAPDLVLIHDAARPLVSRELVRAVIQALRAGAEAVLPLLPVPDSLRYWDGRKIGSAIPREGVCRAQTPQGFVFPAIHNAHEKFAGANATDDIALAERAGMNIVAVMGEETNIKITTPADLSFAERILAGTMETRTGSGFDVHRFAPGDHIWLCGVQIPHTHTLEGHSDADAGLHALTDAVLGALAAGDIGQHFSPLDERWRAAPSRQFLSHAAELVRKRGGAVLHCDVTIICEAPRIAPHRESMRASIAGILGLNFDRISVKATTTEGLGFTGRKEGLAAQATATIRLPP